MTDQPETIPVDDSDSLVDPGEDARPLGRREDGAIVDALTGEVVEDPSA